MRIEYNPRKFLLLVPLPMLRQYFDGRGVLGDLLWDDLTEKDYETVYLAWQALSQFVHFLTGANAGADLDVARAVCVLTLIPSGVRPKTGRIPDGLVDWVTYESRNGNVELALVQESNGRPVGIVKASAIPGSDGRPLIKHFVLPKQPPGTV